jgi:hypothetical protein
MKTLNSPTRTHLENANTVVGQMRLRLLGQRQVPYNWLEFENDVSRILESFLPYCVLRGARLFTASFLNVDDFGLEVDNMLHIRHEETDYLVLIESKHQPIPVEGGDWIVKYSKNGKEEGKDAKIQLNKHLVALHEYLHPVSRNTSLKIVYFVTSNVSNRKIQTATGHLNAELVLLGFDQLIDQITKKFGLDPQAAEMTGDPRRIAQSAFLDLLRLGHAHTHLGHPEISAAIRYVERCRRELDQGLFKLLKPTEDLWLINGSAGMGKSVLLAYTAAVISCGHELYKFQGERGIKPADEVMERTKCTEARLVIAANSQKQLDSLQFWFNQFVEDFQEVAQGRDLFFRRPKFLLFDQLGTLLDDGIPWSAVFLDEAHDLSDQAANKLKQAWDKLGFYLVAACDRHQKVMDSGGNAKVIPGFNFSGKFLRLSKIYRNPAPIYIASLGLMFRWFANSGPKVMPSEADLSKNFGFAAVQLPQQPLTLTMKTDAHPGNSWSHSVARFNDASSVATLLRRERLNRSEVLWVRFSKEDRTFDYESLHRDFTYHNCRTSEAVDLNDKYIKGQEYPVVVIEGFPGLMDRYTDSETHKDTARKMWKFRRELYLCASRATCFLFFVCNDSSSDEFGEIDAEINNLLQSVSSPKVSNDQTNGVRTWGFRIDTANGATIPPKEYGDLVREEVTLETAEEAGSEHSDSVVEVSALDSVGELEPEPEAAIESVASQKPEAVSNPRFSPKYSLISEAAPKVHQTEDAKVQNSIAPSYEQWPLPEGEVPPYEFVIPAYQSASVKDFAHVLGIAIPELLRALQRRGFILAVNARIPLEVMRSIAFEFGCFPAASEDEYAAVREEEDEESDGLSAPIASMGLSQTPITQTQPAYPTKGNPVVFKPPIQKDSKVEEAKRNALDLFSENKHDSRNRKSTRSVKPKEEERILVQVRLKQPILVPHLAKALGLKPFNIMADLIKLGVFPAPNQPLSIQITEQVCEIHDAQFEEIKD